MGKFKKTKKVQNKKSAKNTKSKKKKSVKKKKAVLKRKVIIGNPIQCAKQKKVRRKLYYEREKLIKEIKSGVPVKRQEWINKRLDKVNAKIDVQTFKIFKCGKKYAKLRAAKAELTSKVVYLRKKLKDSPNMPQREVKRIAALVGEYSQKIRDIKTLMGRTIVDEPEKRQVSFAYDENDSSITYELTTIWQVKEKVEGLVEVKESQSGEPKFKTLVINGTSYDLVKDKMTALWALDNYIVDVTASQSDGRVKTPMMQITINRQEKSILLE